MRPRSLGLIIAGGCLGLGVSALIAGWLWVILHPNPLAAQPASWLPWPIACTVSGCLTTTQWQQHHRLRQTFAQHTHTSEPTPAESLTTLMRQYLAHHAYVRSPVTPADAARYRQEILHVTSDEQLAAAINLTTAEYDERVLVPLLEQEQLRQQRRAESADDLYHQLAAERFFVVLSRTLSWHKETATVQNR